MVMRRLTRILIVMGRSDNYAHGYLQRRSFFVFEDLLGEDEYPDTDDDDFNAGERDRDHMDLFCPFLESTCQTKEEVQQMESENWSLKRQLLLSERNSTKDSDLAMDKIWQSRLIHEREMMARQEAAAKHQLLIIEKQIELEGLKRGGGGGGGSGEVNPTILIRSDSEFGIKDCHSFAAMAKLRTDIIRYPDRWTDVRVRDQFPEAVKTDMLIMLGMMRARGEIPPDKADFDAMVGWSPNSCFGRRAD